MAEPSLAQPPYKLVRVGMSSPPIPAVICSAASIGPFHCGAKRRRLGSSTPPGPWGLLTSGYAQFHGQTGKTARSLFHPDAAGGTLLHGNRAGQFALGRGLDDCQKEQRVLLRSVLQQLTAALQSPKPARVSTSSQVCPLY